jgi:hypothetical protein
MQNIICRQKSEKSHKRLWAVLIASNVEYGVDGCGKGPITQLILRM